MQKDNIRPELKFLPFLILYALIILIYSSSSLVGDEGRYLAIAKNIINASSSLQNEINIWNGPGYPLYLIPFVLLGVPIIFIKLSNAILLYLSLILVFKTLKNYVKIKKARLATIIVGCYFPFYPYLTHVLSECLSWFLIALTVFYISSYYLNNTIINRKLILASLSLILLCMTKVLFGYVVTIVLLTALLFKVFRNSKTTIKKSILVTALTILGCLPWLIYTYSLTGNFFYWSSAGGKSLYAMSSPYEKDLGDWRSTIELRKDPNHKEFIDEIWGLTLVERDSAYMKRGLQNLKQHSNKYLKNWTANVGRLFFSYPFSKSKQSIKTLFNLLPNLLLVTIIFLSFILVFLKKSIRQKLPAFIIPLLIFFSIYLFLSSLLSAYNRFFMITVPFWIVFVSIIFSHPFMVNLKKD